MKWHAQVAHIVRKDLYLSRWFLLAYAGVVLGATVEAVGWSSLGTESSLIWTFFLVLLGMILLALLIQADSPQRSNAFWVALPLNRSAVFAAKVAGAVLLLLVLPLLGQFAGLSAHAVAAGELPTLLGRSALVYGAWLGLAAVIAALTPDLRTFAVTLTLVILGGTISMQVVGALLDSNSASASPDPLLWPALVAGGALFLVAHQYRTRDLRRGIWIAALLGVAVLVLPVAARSSAPSVHPASGSVPDSLRPVTLSLRDVRFERGNRAMLGLHLSGISASHQYLLVSPVVHIQMPDGSSERVEIQSVGSSERVEIQSVGSSEQVVIQSVADPYIELNAPILRLGEGLTWLGERAPYREIVTSVSVDLSPGQRAAVSRGDAPLTVLGHLEVREARVRAELSLEPGARTVFDGERVRLLEVENIGEGPAVELRISSVASPRSSGVAAPRYATLRRSPRYALINHEAHEAFVLSEVGVSGGGFGLVLPGAEAWTTTRRLQQNSMHSDVRIGNDWLRHARLLLVDWVPVGSAPVVIRTTDTGANLQRRSRVEVVR
ncbi:MAG: hypothetical protein H0U67_08835 [Gemmatimonadetes bacterium]|nr:hypothetical protein [Gemmatimonadota bacterium]